MCDRVFLNSLVLGDGKPPTFNDGILIMGPYKPLRNWVDEFIPYYMEIMGVDRPERTCMSFRIGKEKTHLKVGWMAWEGLDNMENANVVLSE